MYEHVFSSILLNIANLFLFLRSNSNSLDLCPLRKKRLREEGAKRGVEVRKTKVQTSWQSKTLSNQNKKKKESLLREVMVKIRLERIDIHEGITVEALLDSGVMELVMSSEFVRK